MSFCSSVGAPIFTNVGSIVFKIKYEHNSKTKPDKAPTIISLALSILPGLPAASIHIIPPRAIIPTARKDKR